MMICYLLVAIYFSIILLRCLEAELARSPPKSLGEIRANYQSKLAFAKQQLDWYNKHWGTAKGSASWVRVPQEVIALKDEVAQYRERITYYTKRMGEGKTADGEWVVNKGAKGIQARCALAALNTLGKIPDPKHPSASEGAAP